MSDIVITDPSGALLQNINYINYRNTSVDLIPVYNKTYQLRNSVGKVVADSGEVCRRIGPSVSSIRCSPSRWRPDAASRWTVRT